MAIPRFDAAFDAAVDAMQQAADLLRYFAGSAGDIQSAVIFERIPAALAQAKNAAVAALTECGKNPAAATAALTRYPGAPQTIPAFLSAVTAVEASAQAWNRDLGEWLAGLAVADLVALRGVDMGRGPVAQFVWADGLPGAKIDGLRASPGLASLIAAFEAAGATA